MKVTHPHGGLIIVLSFIIAYLLTMLPLPDWLATIRPYWVAMVLIYWCMALPHRIGVGIGWMAGLLLDITYNSLLGQHALGLALLAFFTVSLHQRVRIFPLWQQSLTILVFCLVYAAVVLWIKGLTGIAPGLGWYLLPVLTTALLWPVVFTLLRRVRRYFRVA
jgi:rod shape-determining protein MreD